MEIKRLVLFGDSLQDCGNLTSLLPLSQKACHDGFFSNGKVAAYYLKDMLSEHCQYDIELVNYAIAAALTMKLNPNSLLKDKSLPVKDQLDCFEQNYGRFKEDDLVIITGGGNDFFFSIYPEFPYLHLDNLYHVSENIYKIVDRVCKLGARRVIVSNIPDITMVPILGYTGDFKPVTKKKQYILYMMLEWLKRYYRHRLLRENKKLEKKIDWLKGKYRDCDLYLFDSFRFMKRMINKPFEFGFGNATDPCILSAGGFDLKGNIQSDDEILIKENPETHLFWDLIHPTTKAHQVVASEWVKHLIG